MKTIATLLSITLFTSIAVRAQTAQWLWAISPEKNYGAQARAICTDAHNNIYIAGQMSNGPMVTGFDSSGNVLWTRTATGNGMGQGICTDANGNIYEIGYMQDADTVAFGTDTIISSGGLNFFIVKYDASGNVRWVKTNASTANNYSATASGIVADAYGNIYVSGGYDNFTLAIGGDTLTKQGFEDGFILKYDTAGNLLRATNIPSQDIVGASGIGADATGNIYITGIYNDPVFILGKDTMMGDPAGVNENVFTAKFDSAGNVIWARNGSGSENMEVAGIHTDAAGNSYVTGFFANDTMTFGNDTIITQYDSVSYRNKVFIARYDPSGNIKWAKGAAYNSSIAAGVSTDTSGHVYLAGYYYSRQLIFANDTITNADTTGKGYNIFIAQFDTAGNIGWVHSIGGTGSDRPSGISVDTKGDLCLSGLYSSPVVAFGNDTLTETNGNGTYFVAKYGVGITDTTHRDTTDIENSALGSQRLLVFPNPSTGQFYFKGMQSGSTLEIYDVLGQNIFSTIVSPSAGGKGEETYPLNISSQAKGVYFYRVTNDSNAVQEGKIVVE